MSYPPQRPGLEHQNDTSYGSASPSFPHAEASSNGGRAPLLVPGTSTNVGSLPYGSERTRSGSSSPKAPSAKLRKPSWVKKDTEMGYEELDDSRAYAKGLSHTTANDLVLLHPDGEAPSTHVGKAYSYLIGASIVTRWTLFIVPILGIIWIPGILSLTSFPNAAVWRVRLLWWSIWLTVVWGGWWAAVALARITPPIIRATIGVVAVSSRRYIDWMQVLHKYIALFAWSIGIWVSFTILINNNQVAEGSVPAGTTDKSKADVDLIDKFLFAAVLCSGLLLFEKFSIQWIAAKFHERSYAERIADQKFAVKSLVALYRNSIDIPGRSDTLNGGHLAKGLTADPRRFFKKLREGVRLATTTTATVFGNVASEIAGSSILQPNSPQAVIKTALESANKSRLLARRFFYSFAHDGTEYLYLKDIEKFFPTPEDAIAVFTLFDKDQNGDVSREEMEMTCLELHREQLSIENSMRDLDSAVGRLDNILMSVYVIVAALIIAVTLEAQLATLVTGAGTLILGLSWLIGGSLQEVLTSIIFLFIKHPFDVGDRVMLNKEIYTVKEIRLLSTVFLDANSGVVQAPNNQLNSLFIQNMRRSPKMSETFTFDVGYSTTFEDLERLRARMLAFVKEERRDYQPEFDVKVKDFPEQGSMILTADIKYKNNFQQGALKAKRRNKWICALKTILAEEKIYGPSGDPNPPPGVTRYAKVPWEIIEREDQKSREKSSQPIEMPRSPVDGWNLNDKNAAILDSADDVFGDSAEVHMPNPQRGLSSTNVQTVVPQSIARTAQPGFQHQADVFELQPRP